MYRTGRRDLHNISCRLSSIGVVDHDLKKLITAIKDPPFIAGPQTNNTGNTTLLLDQQMLGEPCFFID